MWRQIWGAEGTMCCTVCNLLYCPISFSALFPLYWYFSMYPPVTLFVWSINLSSILCTNKKKRKSTKRAARLSADPIGILLDIGITKQSLNWFHHERVVFRTLMTTPPKGWIRSLGSCHVLGWVPHAIMLTQAYWLDTVWKDYSSLETPSWGQIFPSLHIKYIWIVKT